VAVAYILPLTAAVLSAVRGPQLVGFKTPLMRAPFPHAGRNIGPDETAASDGISALPLSLRF
jgi:hypothetical protein